MSSNAPETTPDVVDSITPAEQASLHRIADEIMNGAPNTEPPAVDHFDTLAH